MAPTRPWRISSGHGRDELILGRAGDVPSYHDPEPCQESHALKAQTPCFHRRIDRRGCATSGSCRVQSRRQKIPARSRMDPNPVRIHPVRNQSLLRVDRRRRSPAGKAGIGPIVGSDAATWAGVTKLALVCMVRATAGRGCVAGRPLQELGQPPPKPPCALSQK